MAIVKHNSSKNTRYEDVLEYYTCRHQEDSRTGHYEPILDEYGLMQPRSNCTALYLTADGTEAAPERWASACRRTNLRYGKNNKPGDRKSHEYILSHPAADRDKLSLDDLLEEGRAFAKALLQGYDCLIAVHRDTDNDHIHIALNSVRAGARAEREWMTRDGEGNVLPCSARRTKRRRKPFRGWHTLASRICKRRRRSNGRRRSSVPPSAAPGWTVTSLHWKLR